MASSFPDIDMYLSTLRRCKLISENEVMDLCCRAKNVFKEEPNILKLSCPITVCGTIQGNFPALEEIFRIAGHTPATSFLFLGDLVDRGYYSIETILLVLALKVRHPTRIFLIRGKHESRSMTQVYGFYDECKRKYGSTDVWRACTDVFDFLPLTALINTKIFCVHGGLSPAIQTFDQLELMDRVDEIPNEGAMCDLIFSDPQDVAGWGVSPRGVSFLFGEDIFNQFTQLNSVDLLLRANQLEMEGFRWHFHQKLLTIWSNPNACYRLGNPGAICSIDDNMEPVLTKFYQPSEPKDAKKSN